MTNTINNTFNTTPAPPCQEIFLTKVSSLINQLYITNSNINIYYWDKHFVLLNTYVPLTVLLSFLKVM